MAVLCVVSVSLFWENSSRLTLFLAIVGVIIVVIGKTREDVYLYIIVFFMGALAEAVAVAFGVWEYSLPDIIGVPFWLPFLWGNAGIFIKRIYLEIRR